jgi:glycerophosphoryl diester phosphodiesterase
MDEFRQVCPEVATSGAEAELTPFVIMSLAYLGPLTSPDYVAVQVPEERRGIHILAPRFVRAAHNRNLWVDAWTINETEDMERLIDMGVDGIITDRPDRLLVLLAR